MYTTEIKDRLIDILRNDLKLEARNIVKFLGITESTYTKMVSSVNRDLPKKSQVYLEHFYKTKDWESILKQIKENPKKVESLIKIQEFKEYHDPEAFIKNFELVNAFLKSERLQQLKAEELQSLIKMFDSDKLYESIKRIIRMYDFFSTGNANLLQEQDYLYIGSRAVIMKGTSEDIIKELQSQGEAVVKKVKIKYEDNSLI